MGSTDHGVATWTPAFEARAAVGTDLRAVFLPEGLLGKEGMDQFVVACVKWGVEVVFEEQGAAPLVSARFGEICRAAWVERESTGV